MRACAPAHQERHERRGIPNLTVLTPLIEEAFRPHPQRLSEAARR